jgi:hypothetical protein
MHALYDIKISGIRAYISVIDIIQRAVLIEKQLQFTTFCIDVVMLPSGKMLCK